MDIKTLMERQSWSLEQKIDHSLGTIEQFVERVGGVDKVYVAFSGGKDSTVLLDLVRKLYPDVLAVFWNTGNELPDTIEFVKKLQNTEGYNVQIIRPEITPREVWAKHGFPLVSKETSFKIERIRLLPKSKSAIHYLDPQNRFKLPNKWRFLIEAQYNVSPKCCDELKKKPAHKFQKETGRVPIIGIMADESSMRTMEYLKMGQCNQFDGRVAKSQPLSIWVEEDIWEYINRYGLEVSQAYHKGFKRTGCMGCGFGSHMIGDVRWELLHKYYPKCYDMVMNYVNNGVKFRDALRMILLMNGQNLPDEPIDYSR